MPKRSLMLAGGGVKIAFQAGVLQVWLDEAGIEFDHADAVSAACFNLAMWTQGMSGTEIADNWRNLHPLAALDVNWSEIPKLLYAESLLELNAFREKVFPSWGLDWGKIRASSREATFNVYNFSKHELRPVPAPEMSEDFLIACASLSMWFPPVVIDGDTYIDAIFNTPANLEEAIRRGAEEIWVIWTTSQRGEWFKGFVGNFFGIFEAATNHAYKEALARIERNNRAVAVGEGSEFGRHITVREIKAEVPVHYLLNFSRDRSAEAVNRGVEAAREWCDANGFGKRFQTAAAAQPSARRCALDFSETAKGYVAEGASDDQAGYEQGRLDGTRIEAKFEIHIDDVDSFLTNPEHEARLSGEVRCDALGGALRISQGRYNLFVDKGDPTQKTVRYHMLLSGTEGAYTLEAIKRISNDPGTDALTDPATAFVKISAGVGEMRTNTVWSGIMRAGALDFLKHLASFRTDASTFAERTSVLSRFGAFYLGHLWDVYARGVLPSSPF
jgi:predicted patatin/cPLA2 family phospholipase